MKLTKVVLLLSVISLSACTVPTSRTHFMELMKEDSGIGPWKRMTFSKTIDQPFEKAFNNINDKLQGCIPGGYQNVTMRGNNINSEFVNNNNQIEKVSSDKAEITIQQYHSNTILQSDGGFYLLAADMSRINEHSIKIDFYTGKHYLSIAEAIEFWANGSNKCHGIGGNP